MSKKEKQSSGRPRKYSTAESLQAAIDKYFEFKGIEIESVDGKVKINMNPPSITGLAIHLGFESRQSMYDYERIPEFSYAIKKARALCENFVEENSMKGLIPPAIGIFYLKNYGWTDKYEVTGKDGDRIKIDLTHDEEKRIEEEFGFISKKSIPGKKLPLSLDGNKPSQDT